MNTRGRRVLGTVFLIVMLVLPVCSTHAFAHGPDRPPHQIADLGAFAFEGGGTITNLRMSYVTWGTLGPDKDNAILFMHGFAANHHLADHLIGPGKPLDTDKYFIICTDSLGSTQTGFEHSTSPTSSGLKMDFPAYNLRDMVHAEYKLLTEGLGLSHVVAVTGISSGASKTLQFAVSYPEFADGVIAIVGGELWTSQAFLLGMQRLSSIEACDGWEGGNYEVNPRECVGPALWPVFFMLYSREWWNENITSAEAFQRWKEYWYTTVVGVQDTRDLYLVTKALWRSRLADTPGFDGDLVAALKSIKAKTLFIVSPADQTLTPEGIEIQRRAIPGSRVVSIDSSAGHMICCGEDPEATWLLGQAIRGLLRGLAEGEAGVGLQPVRTKP
jgi:homoserine O-acetyltransferase